MSSEFERQAKGGHDILKFPEEVRDALEKRDERTICGGAFTVTWQHGEKRGLPVTLYCAEPLCITEGRCTGQRFVPHVQQYTTLDKDSPEWVARRLDAGEIVESVKAVAPRARAKGAQPFHWSDRQIARYVGMVWKRTMAALRSDGTQWGT